MAKNAAATFKVEIKNRWTGGVLFTAELDAKYESESDGVKLGLAVKVAVGECANLSGANLSDANLTCADLSGADLSGADLSGANLTCANLSGANLSGANLTCADLSGANLTCADLSGANLTRANLSGADLSGANLSGANLSGADLSGANLTCANLSGADLSGANLTRANLTCANLTRAKGIARERAIDLLMLLDQPGAIRAYKLVDAQLRSPIHDKKITYAIGQTYEEPGADTNELEACGAGLHVATLPWCLREYQEGRRILLVEFTAADIACIPTATDGKFRVRKFTVVGEKDVSALVAAPKKEAAYLCRT